MKWNLEAEKSPGLGKMWLWLTLLPFPHGEWMFSVPYTDNETDIIWKCTLACAPGVYVQTVCIECRCKKRGSVCGVQPCFLPFWNKGWFFFSCLCGGTMWGCETVPGAQNACGVFCKCAFFVNTAPFGRGSRALPYLDSRVTWEDSWILNRRRKKQSITETWHLPARPKQICTNPGRKGGKQQKRTSGARRTEK